MGQTAMCQAATTKKKPARENKGGNSCKIRIGNNVVIALEFARAKAK
jgi:hypothetical protein